MVTIMKIHFLLALHPKLQEEGFPINYIPCLLTSLGLLVVLDDFMLYLLVGNTQERIMSCSFLELFEQVPSLSVISLEVHKHATIGVGYTQSICKYFK